MGPRFVDVGPLSHKAAAAAIRAEGVHVLTEDAHHTNAITL